MYEYSKTQYGWVIMIVFLAALTMITVAFVNQWGDPINKTEFIVFLVIFSFILSVFSAMTIRVREKQLMIIFGIGLFRKRIDLSTVESVESVKYPFYYGYGIRITTQGLLFNVSGRYAVRLTFKSGKNPVLIGTGDPENLIKILEQKIH